jgi:hypothetical protein
MASIQVFITILSPCLFGGVTKCPLRAHGREHASGYECGGEGEPCDGQERACFRPYNSVTREQTSKIAASAFFRMPVTMKSGLQFMLLYQDAPL